MKRLMILVAALAAAPFAQAVDVNQSLVITHAGNTILESKVAFHGMTQAQADALNAKGDKFLDNVRNQGKMSKKNGDFSITLDGNTVKDDGTVVKGAMVVFDKLTLPDMNKVMRANQAYIGDVISGSEVEAVKGKKQPWGK